MRDSRYMPPIRRTMLVAFFILQVMGPVFLGAQAKPVRVIATGTGNTTGHVISLSVTNATGSNVKINAQQCFIPSGGQYQPYITTIPEATVPPGTTTIKLDGYCADVHMLPVPMGDPLPPVEEWIPVNDPTITTPQTGVNILPVPARPPFLPKDIPDLLGTPGFTSVTPDPDAEIIPTWPGTDIPVGGIIDPNNFPERYAPMLIDALGKITSAFDEMKGNGTIETPFGGDPEEERWTTIQQTLWIYIAGVTGENYSKELFHGKVFEQFENKTGTEMAAIPAEDKEKLDSGVDQFWNTFTAVGTEAKVLSKTKETGE